MPVISADAARQHIASGKTRPVYLLVGDDEWEIADLVEGFSDLVDEGFRAFNVERIYASERPSEAESAAVLASRGLPMMSPRRVVLLLRADKLLKPKRKKGEGEEGAEENESSGALEEYVQSPEPMTTLVVAASDANKTLRLTKALYRHATVIECWGLKEAREFKSADLPRIAKKAEAWVKQHVDAEGRRIDKDAASLLAERGGTDIGRLRGDLERVMLYAGDRLHLTRDDVDAVLGTELSRHEWAANEAIKQGNAGEALKQLALLLDEGGREMPYKILGQLGYLVRSGLARDNPPRAREMIEALFRTDLDHKTSGGDPRVLRERLVVELCGGPAPERRPAAPGSLRRR